MQGPIREPKRVSQMESSEIAFSLLDKDKDGYVTSNEMKKISKTLTDDQVNKESKLSKNIFRYYRISNYNVSCFKSFQVFQKFDVDGDGRLNYSEFKTMMKMHK